MPRATGANAWGKPGKSRARAQRWHQRPKPKAPNAHEYGAGLNGSEEARGWPPLFNSWTERPRMSQAEVARQKLLGRARALYDNDYRLHLENELKEAPDLVEK